MQILMRMSWIWRSWLKWRHFTEAMRTGRMTLLEQVLLHEADAETGGSWPGAFKNEPWNSQTGGNVLLCSSLASVNVCWSNCRSMLSHLCPARGFNAALQSVRRASPWHRAIGDATTTGEIGFAYKLLRRLAPKIERTKRAGIGAVELCWLMSPSQALPEAGKRPEHMEIKAN